MLCFFELYTFLKGIRSSRVLHLMHAVENSRETGVVSGNRFTGIARRIMDGRFVLALTTLATALAMMVYLLSVGAPTPCEVLFKNPPRERLAMLTFL